MKRFLRTLSELCFPPRCVGCGKRLPPSLTEKEAPFFCMDCVLDWERSLRAECPQCFAAYYRCTCQTGIMKKSGICSLVKLAPYGGDSDLRVVEHAIVGMKRHPRARAFECCAIELAPALREAVAEAEKKKAISRTVIAYLPRLRRSVRSVGFDQARELSLALSRITGFEVLPLLRRVREGKEQKHLTFKERQENVKGAFALTRSVTGLRVILVDDVVTTGAGMAEAASVLRKGGAAQVLALAVAATPRRRENPPALPKFS